MFVTCCTIGWTYHITLAHGGDYAKYVLGGYDSGRKMYKHL